MDEGLARRVLEARAPGSHAPENRTANGNVLVGFVNVVSHLERRTRI
jgi:hypothetical protein